MAHERLQGQGTATASEPFDFTLLQTTALVHEAFVRMAGSEPAVRGKEATFWQYASEAMQGIVVEHARKRLDRLERLSVAEFDAETKDSQRALQEVLRIDEAMQVLKTTEPELAKVVEMQYFGGFTDEEIARSFGVSDRTIRRAWVKARGLLQAILSAA
jgi:RNA polymerase sigma factor (TIGR02999 family)